MDDTVVIRYDSTELRIPQERAMEFLQLLIPPMLKDANSPEARSHGAELAIIKGILGMPGINGLLSRMLGPEALTPPKGTDKLLWLINWLGAGVITQAAKQDLTIEVKRLPLPPLEGKPKYGDPEEEKTIYEVVGLPALSLGS